MVLQGPQFPKPLVTPADIDTLDASKSLEHLSYVFDAITLTRHRLNGKVPLIGFTGAPVNYFSMQSLSLARFLEDKFMQMKLF